ncbi:MAG: hypothetical protein AB1918_16695 [Pseudomonadota bacterium]
MGYWHAAMPTVETAIAAAYAVSGLAGAALYLPQLRRLLASSEARRAMSLTAWGGWLAMGMVTVAYAAVVLGDGAMTAVSGANAGFQLAVVSLVAGQRVRDRRARPPAA